jgi:hypothetical protein
MPLSAPALKGSDLNLLWLQPGEVQRDITIAGKFGVQIIEQETDTDHIHIIFASKPAVQLSKFINALKSTSARLIFRDYPELKKQLWGGSFWSPSYFLSTVGEAGFPVIKTLDTKLGYLVWFHLRDRFRLSRYVVVLTVTLVIAIGVSRVYMGVHFPSDLVAGFAAGGAWLIACIVGLQTIRYYKGQL